MTIIQRVCEHISIKITQELELDSNQKAVINYGIFAIVQTSIAVILSIIFGMIFNVLIPTLVISFIAVILRKYSGGVHAQKPEYCAAVSTIVSVGGAVIVSHISWSVPDIVIAGIIVFIISFYIIYKLAPVDSKAKPITRIDKRQRLKKNSIFILSVYLILCLIGITSALYNSRADTLLLYVACVYAGVIWQVFTLTSFGHLCMAKVDLLFNKLNRNKGEN